MNFVDSSMVYEYIQNEINYIENEVDFRDKAINENAYKEDLRYLKSLTDEKIEKITQQVNDDEELQDKIIELINYYLYH